MMSNDVLQPTRIGLIGFGYWGPNYARVISELSGAELVACCDRAPAALQLLEQRHPWARRSTRVEDLLDDDEVDAVVIATPTETHAELAVRALEAGKHVLVEKPLATSVEECEAIDGARDGNVLMVGHTFVYNAALVALRGLVGEGHLGDIHYVNSVRAALGPIRQDVNALWDLGPHDVSTFLDLIGSDPVSVSAIGQAFLKQGTEDVVHLHISFADGILAHAHLSWLDPYKVRQTTVVGTRRMAVFNDVATDEPLKILDRGASYDAPSEEARGQSYGHHQAVLRNGTITIPRIPVREPLREQLKEFLEAIRDRREPYSGVREATAVVAILEAAQRSLDSGGMPQRMSRRPRVSERQRTPAGANA